MSLSYRPVHLLAATSNKGSIVLARRDTTNDVTAANMVLKKEPRTASLQGGSLQTEERVLKRLSANGIHPHILQVKDSIENDDEKILVFDYFSGGDLFTKVEGEGALGLDKGREIFHQLASAVKHCHENGIAHRDITLENVLLDGAGNVSLCDFGYAWEEEKSGPLCTFWVGKELYIAPEAKLASSHAPYNAKTADLWSLGVCLFTSLAGVPPVERATNDDKRFRLICNGKLRAMVKAWGLLPKFGEEAMDLVEKLLVPDPEQRLNIEQVLAHSWLSHCPAVTMKAPINRSIRGSICRSTCMSGTRPKLPSKSIAISSKATHDTSNSSDVTIDIVAEEVVEEIDMMDYHDNDSDIGESLSSPICARVTRSMAAESRSRYTAAM